MKSESEFHQTALLKESIEYLRVLPGEVYVDATLGGGGHSREILEKGGKVFGLDCDTDAISWTGKRLAHFCHPDKSGRVCPLNAFRAVQANFVDLAKVLKENGIANPAGIIFDLGTSFHQLESRGRGFSFQKDEPLDMRMNKDLKVTAAQLIAGLGQKELCQLFTKLGEERYSRAIADLIVSSRRLRPIKNTGELAKIACQVYQKYGQKTKIHPATKIFQALRIAVNDELNNLKEVLPQALECLAKEGRLVIISFQGLEDRIVKQFLKDKEEEGKLKILTKKPVNPGDQEKINNPRARSAKLRAAEKL